MLDQILLAPYYITLKIRHFLYDKGIRKVHVAEIPTISVGNVTVGGTGKTPHTEMIVRMLSGTYGWKTKNIAVLSRGYGRRSKGFQQVVLDTGEGMPSPASYFGDEPVQIKRKFPKYTVAVDKDRVEGCDFLAHPEKLQTSKKGKKCFLKEFKAADIVILDDAFQYRRLKPTLSIVLVNYHRPVSKDHLLPVGRLRDLPKRMQAADVLIVSKCPYYMEESEKAEWASDLGLKDFDPATSIGTARDGKPRHLFFTTIQYDSLAPLYPEGDQRYAYSKQAILFTGIADDSPLKMYLTDSYKIVRHIPFGDHHVFNAADLETIKKAAEEYPLAVLVTTEKDSQRLTGLAGVPDSLKDRLFYAPIKAEFSTEGETEIFRSLISLK